MPAEQINPAECSAMNDKPHGLLPGDFRFLHRLRVRWAEAGAQKAVCNAHDLMYFDTAMIEYWRALAVPYESGLRHLGGDLYARKVMAEFESPARIDDDDVFDVGLRCDRVGRSSIAFAAALFRGGNRLASYEVVYGYTTRPASSACPQKAQPVPAALRDLLLGFEAGEAVRSVHMGDWIALGAQASALRRAVFVQEQGIAPELEWDALDAQSLHVVARNRIGQVIATGRLLPAEAGGAVARIGRMAVEHSLRGSGHGAAVLRALEDAACRRGQREVLLHAQRSAEGFYRRLGYSVAGAPFEEAGIAHIEMRRML